MKTYTYSINTLNGLYIQNNWNFNGLKKYKLLYSEDGT